MRTPWWIVGALVAGTLLLVPAAMAEEMRQVVASDQDVTCRAVGLGAAAAFAIAVSVLGASHAVGRIGSAAIGASAEKPELLTRSLIFVALAEGLAVLGFAVAMMLLQKI